MPNARKRPLDCSRVNLNGVIRLLYHDDGVDAAAGQPGHDPDAVATVQIDLIVAGSPFAPFRFSSGYFQVFRASPES
ncbi:MAG: hypothetical protein IID34_00250 [Planctomycetes bacterium]|nr:hypothetical protein [Planctomycetota bacterium]